MATDDLCLGRLAKSKPVTKDIGISLAYKGAYSERKVSFMQKFILLSLLVSASAMADQTQTPAPAPAPTEVTTTYSLRCDLTSVNQFIDNDGKAQASFVSKDRTVGTQNTVQTGDTVVVVTAATTFSSTGGDPETQASYTANRTTKTYQLGAGKVREVSDIKTHNVLPGDLKYDNGTNSKDSSSKTVNDYVIQADGSRKLVASYVNGTQVALGSEVSYDMVDSDGTKTSVDQDDQPEDSPTSDGGTYRTLQYKSVCTLTPQK
jgi:hypothetical protein